MATGMTPTAGRGSPAARGEAAVPATAARGETAEHARTVPARTVRDDAAVRGFIERFASVMIEAGVQPMAARVFAALLATDSGQLTAAELAGILQASPAAVSGAVRYLAQFSMVSREREPGSRRDRYRVLDDVWYESTASRDHVLARWEAAAREGAEILGRDSTAGQRFADSADFFTFVRREMPALLARWRQHAREAGQRSGR